MVQLRKDSAWIGRTKVIHMCGGSIHNCNKLRHALNITKRSECAYAKGEEKEEEEVEPQRTSYLTTKGCPTRRPLANRLPTLNAMLFITGFWYCSFSW